MARYRCRKCNRECRALTRLPKLCPYCGAENSLEDVEVKSEFTNVDELLR